LFAPSFSDAAANSKHMGAIVPVLASARLFPIFKAPNGGGLSLDLGLRWLYLVFNLQLQLTKSIISLLYFIKSLLVYSHDLDKALMHTPLTEADSIVTLNKQPVKFFQSAIRNLDGNEDFWRDKDHLYNFNGAARNGVCPPVHIIGGWYDFFLHQQLQDYKLASVKQKNTKITIGNFAHWDVHNFFPISTKIATDLFDEVLKGNRAKFYSKFGDKPVNIFVMGAGENHLGKWSNIATFPPPIVSTRRFYLGRGNRLESSLFDDMSGKETYVYDPKTNPTPAIGGTTFNPSNCGVREQNRFEKRSDVVVFTSDKLKNPIEVCGYIKAILYVKTNRQYTDFVGRLCCVFPNGTSINICDGMMRVSPDTISETDSNCMRLGVEDSGQQKIILRLTIEIGVTAFKFQQGQAVRLQVCSGAHSRWCRNYGTGEELASATVMEIAEQTILFGNEYSSRIELPETNIS
jgi:uncharacterized protein